MIEVAKATNSSERYEDSVAIKKIPNQSARQWCMRQSVGP